MNNFRTIITRLLLHMVLLCSLASCTLSWYDYDNGRKNVFIIYSAGYNNLYGYLKEDNNEAIDNFLPTTPMDILMIFSHLPAKNSDYTIPSSPVLTQVRMNEKGIVVRDTLKIYPESTNSASAETLHDVLDFVKVLHPNSSYGILFSSHSTGWAPADYCNDPDKYESGTGGTAGEIWSARRADRPRREPTWGIQLPDGSPVVKSFGAQFVGSYKDTREMDITDMAKAIPMQMEYIIFDSCLMGGIEVAYEFRNVCRYMIFSQTEILADGMDYKKITSRTSYPSEYTMRLICQDYYSQYLEKSGQYKSATISLIDCTRLEALADVCKDIFESRREEIDAREGANLMQEYFRAEEHQWFYDLESIVRHIGTAREPLMRFYDALDQCVLYKAATEKFISISIDDHCGLSMYLPYKNRTYLNNFYKTLEWNKATGLVQ